MKSEVIQLISAEDLARKRVELRMEGVNITAWANAHSFSREMVYAVLHGRARAHRGQAFEIARTLGLFPKVHSCTVDGTGGNIEK